MKIVIKIIKTLITKYRFEFFISNFLRLVNKIRNSHTKTTIKIISCDFFIFR